MSGIILCPFCGAVGRGLEALSVHTRQECESRILARIDHLEDVIAFERQHLDALHAATNRDDQVPA